MSILCEGLNAHGALVGPLACVGARVPGEVDAGREAFATLLTVVGALPCVHAPVLGNLVPVLELLPTDLTFIRLLTWLHTNTH